MMKWSWYIILTLAAVAGNELDTEMVKELSVDEGSIVILNCSCKSENEITWVGSSKPTTSSEKGEINMISYTDGCLLNPDFNGTNIKVICNKATEECNLEISKLSNMDEGVYKCVTSNFTAQVYNVFVRNLPKVIVTHNFMNGTLLLHCNPLGIPNDYTFSQFEQRSEFDEHIRFLNTSKKGSVLSTSIKNPGLQDTGIYMCKVSNGVHDHNGIFQSGKTLVKLKDAPVFLGDDIIRYSKIGEVICISAVVYNRHEILFNATFQSKIEFIYKLKIKSFVKAHKIFHGTNVTLNASLICLQLDLVTRKYFTIYILKICNTYGCRDIKIDIRIDTSKVQGSTRSKHQDIEIVFAALAILSVLGIGMVTAFFIKKRVTDTNNRALSQTEDLQEDTQGQSVENRLYQSREIVNSDNPEHVLQSQANEGYVYHATASSSQAEVTRNNQSYLSGSHLNYSEVVFQAGPSSNSNIIHGADDKTIYTEIDLASSARFHHDCSDTNSDEDFIYLDGIVNLERKNEIK